MKEADVVAKIRYEVKKQLPLAKFLKHNDFSSEGIPDLSISFAGMTTWVEVKLLKAKETQVSFAKHLKPGGRMVQLVTCQQLEKQARCYYLIAYPLAKQLRGALLTPSRVAELLEYKMFSRGNFAVGSVYDGELALAIDNLVWRACAQTIVYTS